jgi:hypothetical protein
METIYRKDTFGGHNMDAEKQYYSVKDETPHILKYFWKQ